jgi:hypothetical protein
MMEECEMGGTTCGIPEEVRRTIVDLLDVKIHRDTNIWQAWREVKRFGGGRMERWGNERGGGIQEQDGECGGGGA